MDGIIFTSAIFAIAIICTTLSAILLSREIEKYRASRSVIVKADPCQVETMMEARDLIESGSPCNPVKVKDISGYQVPDDVDEFSIHYNKIEGIPQPKPKHYKRINGEFVEVLKPAPKE